MNSIYDIDVTTIDGRHQTLEPFRGRALLIVNVASRCSFHAPYAGLEALYRRHKDRGFRRAGLSRAISSCTRSLGMTPRSRAFARARTTLRFPVREGQSQRCRRAPAVPLLEIRRPGLLGTESIKWNFGKFLVDRAAKS